MDAYHIPLTVFRNRGWTPPFTFLEKDGQTPVDVSQDELALVVLPLVPPTGARAVITSSNPRVQVNVVTFDVPDQTMGTLSADHPYNWQFLRRPAGSGAGTNSYVVCAGPLTVLDSPVFPSST